MLIQTEMVLQHKQFQCIDFLLPVATLTLPDVWFNWRLVVISENHLCSF